MNISVSSVFITLVITLLMIFLFYLVLFNKKLIFLLRSDLLIVLSFYNYYPFALSCRMAIYHNITILVDHESSPIFS